jgi:hypothetical protein
LKEVTMQGIYIRGNRPKSKAEVKRVMDEGGEGVNLEATSWFGNEYDGPVNEAPDGTYYFVGPDPHTKRNFYGTIVVSPAGIKVS